MNLVNQPIQLKTLVESGNCMRRHVVLQRKEAQTFAVFPTFTINGLRNLTLEVYQRNYGKFYTEEHICDYGIKNY